MTRRQGEKHTRENLMRKIEKNLVQGVDGFWTYWPTTNNGALGSRELRMIAAKLESLNKPVLEQLERVMSEPPKFAPRTGQWMNGQRYRK